MKLIEKVAYTAYIFSIMILITLVTTLIVSLIFYIAEIPPTKDSKPDMGGLCMSLCKKEYGKHITKALPVNGRGCYCYP